jgi:hypothetical protein
MRKEGYSERAIQNTIILAAISAVKISLAIFYGLAWSAWIALRSLFGQDSAHKGRLED